MAPLSVGDFVRGNAVVIPKLLGILVKVESTAGEHFLELKLNQQPNDFDIICVLP